MPLSSRLRPACDPFGKMPNTVRGDQPISQIEVLSVPVPPPSRCFPSTAVVLSLKRGARPLNFCGEVAWLP
jgi:hypothetical protein